jgi:predicted metal-dependent phosphoesterase TrpH
MAMIDLHSHSSASDGSLSPSSLVAEAARSGVSVLALTDHDTVDGLAEAGEAAVVHNIKLIPGIELEAAWNPPGVFHVLGLGIRPDAPALASLLDSISKARQHRNSMMISRMGEHGIDASLAAVGRFAEGPTLARPHFADYLVSIGKAKNRQAAFDNYLTPGKPFFEPYPGMALDLAVNAIHESGGLAVIAHPLSLYVSWTRYASLMAEWKALGVDGVEAWHPSASWKDARRLTALAEAAGLKISAGSDFHGDGRPDRCLGRSLEERHKIDDSFLALFES